MRPARFAICRLVTGLVLALAVPGVAVAESGGAQAVDEGLRLAEEARFDDALAAFDRAAASDDLDREHLVGLLEGRAMVHHARGDEDAFTRDAQGLGALVADYAPARRIPPRLARRLRAATAGARPLSLSAAATRESGAVVVTATVADDPGGLVRAVVISAQVGDGPYVDHAGTQARLVARPTEAVRYFVRALGPGQVVLASVASRPSPRVVAVSALPEPTLPATDPAGTETETVAEMGTATTATGPTAPSHGGAVDGAPSEPSEGLPLWPFLVGGAVVVVAVVVIVAAFLIPGTDTNPGLPGLSL